MNNIQELVSSIVNHPNFRQAIGNIISSSSSSTTVAVPAITTTTTPTSSGRTASVNINTNTNIFSTDSTTVHDARPAPNGRPNFQSAIAEFSHIFRRGSSSSSSSSTTSSTNPASSRRIARFSTPTNRRQSRQRSSSNNKLQVYRTRDVILLPSPNETEVIRGHRKGILMSHGFVRTELQILKCWSSEDVLSFFEQCFEEKLINIPKIEGQNRISIMLGIGRHLQKPCLGEGQQIDGFMLARLFGQKTIWLLPIEVISFNEIDDAQESNCPFDEDELPVICHTCVNCGDRVYRDEAEHARTCRGGSSEVKTDEDVEMRDFEFGNNKETFDKLKCMFPSSSDFAINAAIGLSSSWDEVIDLLTKEDDPPVSAKDVIDSYISENVIDSPNRLEIEREKLWRNLICFYKVSIVDKTKLFKKLNVEFDHESGIDAGALTVELFTKWFEIARKELFEVSPTNDSVIPKRIGGNLTLYKIFGISLGHSLLQKGPPFPFLAKWCYAFLCEKGENEIVTEISNCSYKDLIPLNSGTATVLSFLDGLSNVNSNDDIYNLLDRAADGPAFEQIINSTQWPIDMQITLTNIDMLKQMIVLEELYVKREKQLNAIKEGLSIVGLLPLLKLYGNLLEEYFVGRLDPLSPEEIIGIIDWKSGNGVSPEMDRAVSFLQSYIESCTVERLKSFLKFTTSFEILTKLYDLKLELKPLAVTKALPEAQACFQLLHLPIQHNSLEDFSVYMDKAMEFGCEGYGNL